MTLTPRSMASIEGEVRLKNMGGKTFVLIAKKFSSASCAMATGNSKRSPSSASNRFAFHNVTPGTYQFFVTTTRPDKVFLETILVDGASVQGRRFTISEAKFVSIKTTLNGDMTRAAGHISPGARRGQRWETEGMRPRSSVAGKVQGDSDAVYTVRLLPLDRKSSGPDTLTTLTGRDGSFHFDGVLPGIYNLRAHGKDYVRFDYGGRASGLRGAPLLIMAGARLEGVTLNAPRRASGLRSRHK